ncbi:acetyl-CoA C-acetyltransferase [Paenarthrobacter nicotinovorans]|uniref:acetyl-CoA C-acyltransferase n=1 Tax=Paenarthrobacter nicotinovorans TaxID=29320 RepID=A0ABT9TW93_PAENI|nr:acetyl-CoA C-acyltransferase [Paenarthrobacter nicotinovorans]MDQ0104792.1 acetyl-CoA C-acetyltransferase [Paenarthrobacter nicotinovorans]
MKTGLEPRDAVVVAYRRTPIGRARKGSLAAERPEDLALAAVQGVLAAVPQLHAVEFEDAYVGCAVPQGAQGDNIGRRVMVLAGMDTVPAVTVNRFCASSLQATAMAAHAVRAGDGDAFLVAGVESTSSTPPVTEDPHPAFADAALRADATFEAGQPWSDPRNRRELPDVYLAMGKTAEFVARETGTTRRDQDEWALESQRRAVRAVHSGYFASEIVPVRTAAGRVVGTDDGPRPGTTLDALSGLTPAFHERGTVTAGNASPLNDGASALVVMSARRAGELGLQPLARILGSAASGLSPEIMGLGPVDASRHVLDRLGLSIGDVDIVELNEAFAAQVVPVVRKLGADPARVNPFGGAIALGHPFGATGVRLVGTLINGLRATDGSLGLATLCVGGGQGMAMVVERLS